MFLKYSLFFLKKDNRKRSFKTDAWDHFDLSWNWVFKRSTKMFNYLFLSKREKSFKNKHYMIKKIKRAESLSKQIVICSHALKMLTMDNILLKKLIFLYNFCWKPFHLWLLKNHFSRLIVYKLFLSYQFNCHGSVFL